MSLTQMLPDYAIFEVLSRHKVPFVIIGGHAVYFHGFPRQTEDTDIVWLRSQESEMSLSQALIEVEAHYIGREIDPATGIERIYPVDIAFIRSHPLMMLCTSRGFLDLFSYIPGFPEADVKELFDLSVESNGLRYASLDWLFKMKTASGRPKDLIDLERLNLK